MPKLAPLNGPGGGVAGPMPSNISSQIQGAGTQAAPIPSNGGLAGLAIQHLLSGMIGNPGVSAGYRSAGPIGGYSAAGPYPIASAPALGALGGPVARPVSNLAPLGMGGQADPMAVYRMLLSILGGGRGGAMPLGGASFPGF